MLETRQGRGTSPVNKTIPVIKVTSVKPIVKPNNPYIYEWIRWGASTIGVDGKNNALAVA